MKEKLVVGVTGIAGSGKSTFSTFLEEFGAKVIRADEEVRRVVEEMKDELKELFGEGILEGRRINRKRLGELVFGSEENYRKFNDLIYPHIRKFAIRTIEEKGKGIWVVDAALIHEYQLEPYLDYIVTIVAPYEECIKRFMQKTGYPRWVASMVIKSQLSQEEKAKRSHFVVENNGTLEELKENAREIIEEIKRRNGSDLQGK